VVITHCKNLCDGDYLVDDRAKNGASEFPGEWVQFGTERYPDWEEVTRYLISETLLHDDDDEKLNKRLVNYAMVEKTIKMLDAYTDVLNAKVGEIDTKEILAAAKLANKWLKVLGEDNELAYYID
jgi:predicted ATP-dependent Lon-type protease